MVTKKERETNTIKKHLKQKHPKSIVFKEKDVKSYCAMINRGDSQRDAINIIWPQVLFETEELFEWFVNKLSKQPYFKKFLKQSDETAVNYAKSYFNMTKADHVQNLMKLKDKALSKEEDIRLAFNIETKIGESMGFYQHDKSSDVNVNISFKDMINELEAPKTRQIDAEVVQEVEEIPDNDSEIDGLPLIK